MRLDRLLANSGYGSRTAVKEIIRDGLVQVDGVYVKDSGFHVDESQYGKILISGANANIKKYLHFVMNKPAGVITALEDKRHRTISEFIPANLAGTGLFPVGRLDIDTTGLLILTNDGNLCHRLTSPKWHVDKTYYLELAGKYLSNEDKEKLGDGVILDDGLHCKPAALEILSSSSALLTITEGKYHQIKRMMKALGGTVTILERRKMGPVVLTSDLEYGMLRELTETEITALYESSGLRI